MVGVHILVNNVQYQENQVWKAFWKIGVGRLLVVRGLEKSTEQSARDGPTASYHA